jgi:hypothetical protein
MDLSLAPPRGPREWMAGLDLDIMARTVDKLRATLPGGDLGPYKISGYSSRLLDALGIEEGALRDAVAAAADEATVVKWILERTDPSKFPAMNERMESLTIADRKLDPEWLAANPVAKGLPDDTTRFDYLEIDDAIMFPAPGR